MSNELADPDLDSRLATRTRPSTAQSLRPTTATLLLAIACSALILGGCARGLDRTTALPGESITKEPIETSLFPSDQAVLGEEAVQRILGTRLELPAKSKVALMRFPNSAGWGSRYYGSYYWRDEDYRKLQESQVETLSTSLLGSGQIADAVPLPSLMTPRQLTIPLLREAALRMQADLLLVYRIGSDTYSQYRTFSRDKVKSYSTCELVLLDVRTGLVPFTRVISRERLEVKQSGDLDLSETMRRAEQSSATEALKMAADDLAGFLKAAPKKGA